MKPSRIVFQGQAQAPTFKWAPVYAEVASEEQFRELCRVDRVKQTAPIEHKTRWVHNNELTGGLYNFCIAPGCRVCGGRKTQDK